MVGEASGPRPTSCSDILRCVGRGADSVCRDLSGK